MDIPVVRDEESHSFYHILKFIKPDWYILSIGVFLYGVIGAGYPIFGALVAHASIVSPVSNFLHYNINQYYNVCFRC